MRDKATRLSSREPGMGGKHGNDGCGEAFKVFLVFLKSAVFAIGLRHNVCLR
jgi:hypothetical protein